MQQGYHINRPWQNKGFKHDFNQIFNEPNMLAGNFITAFEIYSLYNHSIKYK